MAARNRCHHNRHISKMAPSSGRWVMSIISPRAGKGSPDCSKTKLSSLPCTGSAVSLILHSHLRTHVCSSLISFHLEDCRHALSAFGTLFSQWFLAVVIMISSVTNGPDVYLNLFLLALQLLRNRSIHAVTLIVCQ